MIQDGNVMGKYVLIVACCILVCEDQRLDLSMKRLKTLSFLGIL